MSAIKRAMRAGHFAHAVQLQARAEQRRETVVVITSAVLYLAAIVIWVHLLVVSVP